MNPLARYRVRELAEAFNRKEYTIRKWIREGKRRGLNLDVKYVPLGGFKQALELSAESALLLYRTFTGGKPPQVVLRNYLDRDSKGRYIGKSPNNPALP